MPIELEMTTISMPPPTSHDPFMSPPPLTSVHPALRPGTPPVSQTSPSKPRRFASLIMSLRSPKQSRPVLTAPPQTPPCCSEKNNRWKPLPPVPVFSPWKDASERPLTPSKKSFCHPIPPGKREVSGSTTNSNPTSSKSGDVSPLIFMMEESPTMPGDHSFMAQSTQGRESDTTKTTSFTTAGSYPPRNDSLPGSAKSAMPSTMIAPDLSWLDDSLTSSYETTPVAPATETTDMIAFSTTPPAPDPIEPAPLRLSRKTVPLPSPTAMHPAYRRDITDTSVGGVPLTPATPSKRSSSRSSKSAWWLSPVHKQAQVMDVFSPAKSQMGDIQSTTPSVSRSTLATGEQVLQEGRGLYIGSKPAHSQHPEIDMALSPAVEGLRRFINLMATVEEQATGEKQEGARLAGMLVQRAVDVCELRGLA